MSFDSKNGPPLPVFGEPHFPELLKKATETYRPFSGPATTEIETSTGNLAISVPPPLEFQRRGKRDDAGLSGFLRGKYPIVIAADQASGRLENGEVIASSGDGPAAQAAILGLVESMAYSLTDRLDSPRIFDIIRNGFQYAAKKIANNGLLDRTTLQVAFLYFHGDPKSRNLTPVWYSAKVGDGHHLLGSPEHTLNGFCAETELDAVRPMRGTESLGPNSCPFVSMCSTHYSPNDFLTTITDGMSIGAIQNREKTYLSHLVETLDPSSSDFHQRAFEKLKSFPFLDDAAMAVIGTKLKT